MAAARARAMVLTGDRRFEATDAVIRLIESDSGLFARLRTRSYPQERTEEATLHLAGRTGEPPAVHVAILP